MAKLKVWEEIIGGVSLARARLTDGNIVKGDWTEPFRLESAGTTYILKSQPECGVWEEIEHSPGSGQANGRRSETLKWRVGEHTI